MTDLLKLAARCEAADASEQATLLREAFGAIHRWLPRDMPCGQMPEGALAREARFEQLMRAEASLDAAMTLVPEGWEWRADSTGVAECWNGSPNDVTCHSTTPALALCAASLRARAFLTKQETV